MHVHVSHPDGEAKFWLRPEVELATQTGLATHVIGEAQQLVEDHLHWPLLDIDLSVESIRTPAAFPLVARVTLDS
jgi:hypothetical protein